MKQAALPHIFGGSQESLSAGPLRLVVTLDVTQGCFFFHWYPAGSQVAAARDAYGEVKELDETLFQKDYESL